MSLTLSHVSTYKFFVNTEAVSLYDRNGVYKASVADAKRLPQGKRERLPSEGQYIGTAVGWFLPSSQVAVAVEAGDYITDAGGVSYTVLAVGAPGTFYGCYRCSCVALMVLGHTITWHLPTDQTDTFASPIVDQSATLPTQLCAIQELACEEVTYQGVVQGFRRTFAIWLLGDVTLSMGAIGVDESGLWYTVKAVNTRNRLDELLRVTAVREPG